MLSVEGYYDGESVKLLEPVNQKNQPVIVTFTDVHKTRRKFARTAEQKALIREAILSNKFVIHTDIDADEYIKELRGNFHQSEAEVSDVLSVEGYSNGESVKLFEPVAQKNFDSEDQIVTDEDRALMLEALLTDKFVSPVPTNYDVDAFIRESRGYNICGGDNDEYNQENSRPS